MYSDKFKKKVIRAAKKGSIPKAAREFVISSNTIRLWLAEEKSSIQEQKEPVAKRKQSSEKPTKAPTLYQIKKEQFNQLKQQPEHFISIIYKKACINSPKLPLYLLTAYDNSSGLLNFCFTYEKNKSNKMLYMLYIGNFYRSNEISDTVFLTEQKLAEIKTSNQPSLSRMIEYQLDKIIKHLKPLITGSVDLSELMIKSFVFLADYNLNLNSPQLIHPPFVLEDNISSFNFDDNTMTINTISETIRKSIFVQIEKFNQVKLNTEHINSERLFKIYNFFSNKGIENKQIEDRIIWDVRVLQRMGDLKKTELLLQVLINHKALTPEARNRFYMLYGVQKLRSGSYEEARKYYLKAINGSRKIGNQLLEFDGLVNLCSFFLHQCMNANAYRYLRLAQHLANQLNQDFCYVKSNFIAGYYYYATNKFKMAVEFYEQAAIYAKKSKSEYYYNYSISEIANSYIELKHFKKALRYAKLSLIGNLKNGLKIPLSNSYYFCAKCYFSLQKYESAHEYIVKQLEVLADLNYLDLEYLGRDLFIRILLMENRRAEAVEQFSLIKKINAQIDNKYIHLYFTNLSKETELE